MKRPVSDKRRLEGYLPSEGVPISFVIATIGARLGAQLIDVLLTYASVILLANVLVGSGILADKALFTLIILIVFLIRVPYYILSELVWNGRTLGKRIVGIRVINADGRRLTPHQIVARNLMKEVEFFTPGTMLVAATTSSPPEVLLILAWTLIIVIVPLANRRRQRLGDMVAGTLVVENPRHALLADLAVSAPIVGRAFTDFEFLPEHLDVYGCFELQTLENVLRDPATNPTGRAEIEKIARTIIRKIGYTDPVQPGQEQSFLNAFYCAQREHLETLRLFGTRREDKFHETTTAKK